MWSTVVSAPFTPTDACKVEWDRFRQVEVLDLSENELRQVPALQCPQLWELNLLQNQVCLSGKGCSPFGEL